MSCFAAILIYQFIIIIIIIIIKSYYNTELQALGATIRTKVLY